MAVSARVAELLAENTRPDFEDEVEAAWQPAFLAIEEVEYPQSLEKDGAQELWLYFELEDGDAVENTLWALQAAGARQVYGYVMDDDVACTAFLRASAKGVQTLLEIGGDSEDLEADAALVAELEQRKTLRARVGYLRELVETGRL